MATRRALRSVSGTKTTAAPPATRAARKPKVKTLAQAIDGGVYLEILEAQQRQMALDVKEVAGPAKAAMYRQIALISKEIEQLRVVAKEEGDEGGGTGTPEDEKFDPEAI